MSTNILTVGSIPYVLAPTDQFEVTIDISTWLDGDTIDSVAFTAIDSDGDSATSTVINSSLSTYSDYLINAYIIGGAAGNSYIVKCNVITANGDKKAFYIKWICDDSGS
jgi:hypothetical protein